MKAKLAQGLLIIGLCILNGCSDSQGNVVDFVADVKKNAVGKIEPLPPFKVYKSEDYTAQNFRSPFSKSKTNTGNVINETPISEEGIKQQPRPDAGRKREFLEGMPLGSFSMVGTLNKGTYFWGLVQDSNGKVYSVKVGDYIGQNSGRITKIDEDEIDIDETVPDGKGGWMQTKTVLTLKAQ